MESMAKITDAISTAPGFQAKNRAKRFMTYRLFNGINLIRNKLHKVHNAESWKWLYIAIFMSIKRAETRGIEET